MADVFADLATSLADLLNTTQEIAGFILGFTVIAIFTIAFTWALGKDSLQGYGVIIAAATAYIFVVLAGWFPLWTVIFLIVVIVAAKLFGGQSQSVAIG